MPYTQNFSLNCLYQTEHAQPFIMHVHAGKGQYYALIIRTGKVIVYPIIATTMSLRQKLDDDITGKLPHPLQARSQFGLVTCEVYTALHTENALEMSQNKVSLQFGIHTKSLTNTPRLSHFRNKIHSQH